MRKRRRVRLEERRQQVPFEVMHGNSRNPPAIGQATRQRRAGEKGPDQAGTRGIGNCSQVARLGARALEHLRGQREELSDVIARCKLGNDPAVKPVKLDLAVERVRKEASLPVDNGGGALIAGGLDREDTQECYLLFCVFFRGSLESRPLKNQGTAKN
jgi:hypothetical protein